MSDQDAADTLRDEELAATHEDALTAAIRERLKDVHTCLPGIIQSYDPTKQTVTVQCAINRVWIPDDDDDENGGSKPIPVIQDVPVQFPGGSFGALTFPVQAGDECLVCFSERCIDHWWANGGVQDPAEYRMHDYSDGSALLGFSSVPNVPPNLSTDGIELRTKDGTTMFRLEKEAAIVGTPIGAQFSVMGEAFRLAQKLMNVDPSKGLAPTFSAMATACTGPLAPLQPGFTALAAAVAQFETTAAATNNFLATRSKVG